MKEGWERMVQPAALDLRQLGEIIKSAFLGKRLLAAERIGVGLSNANYKIYLEGSSAAYVLRLYRGNASIAGKEASIAQRIRHLIPVADFLYMDLTLSAFDRPWAVLEWKEGVLLRDVFRSGNGSDIASAAASAGRTLAQIHSFAFSESGFLDHDLKITDSLRMGGSRLLSFIESCLFDGACGEWLGKDKAQEVWSFCKKYSPLLTESQQTPVLVHSDYNGLNILMQPGPAGYSVSAVLDWEDAFAWSRYADIANMLRYEEEGSVIEQHFIQAYCEQGAVLEPNWKLLSRLEDMAALCDMLNHSTVNTPNRVSDLKHLIMKTVRSYDRI